MLTLVYLHRILKKCRRKDNEVKILSNLNSFLEVSLFKIQNKSRGFEIKIREPPEFQCVHKNKKYNTVQKQATLGSPWNLEGEKARAKPTNYYDLSCDRKLWATSGKHELTSRLWLETILWPRRPRCCDRYTIIGLKTSFSFHLRVSKSHRQNSKYLQNCETHEPKWPLSTLDVFRKSYLGFPCHRSKVYIKVSDIFAYFAP